MKTILSWILWAVYSAALIKGLKIKPARKEWIVEANTSFSLSCRDKGPIRWIYSNRTESTVECKYTKRIGHICNLTMKLPDYLDTGDYICESSTTNRTTSIYVFVSDTKNLIALDRSKETYKIKAKVDDSVTIPCKPTSPKVNITLEKYVPFSLFTQTENIDFPYEKHVGFTLKHAHPDYIAIYKCCGKNNTSNIIQCQDIEMDVEPAISMDTIPTPQIEVKGSNYLVEGNNVTLDCFVTAPMGVFVRLEWRWPNDDDIEIESQNIITKKDIHSILGTSKYFHRTLTIYNLTKNNQGLYTCEVTDMMNYNSKSSSFIIFLNNEKSL